MMDMKAIIIAYMRLFMLLLMAVANPAQAADALTIPLTVETQQGVSHRFEVELATTPAQQQRGLMFREYLPENHGMLFVYNPPRPIKMWMKNTYIPLDMLFVAPTREIVHIHEMAEPHSLEAVGPASGNIWAVVELAGGVAARLGLKPGDSIMLKDELEASHDMP